MKRICWAILTAFIILFGSYLLSNYPYPLFDSNKVFSYTELLRSHRHASHYPEDSVLCINLAMDKQLATAVVDGLPMGKVAVSDRSKLLRFLQAAQGSGYRYIFLDVRFPSGLDTPDDATLFSVIEQMPRLVISNHQAGGNYRIADSALLAKAALADYRMTAFNGFTRYQYLQRGGESVALRMYREMDGGDIHRFGPFYASCHRLCHNAQFLQIPPFVMDDIREDNSLRYPYLGVHLLDWYTDEELHALLKDKIILIGDFDEERHATYVGDVPGAMLSFLGWWELHTGKHLVPVWLVVLLLASYTLISLWLLFSHRNWYDYIPGLNRIRNSAVRFLLSLIGWGFLLTVLRVILYLFWGVAISVAIPSLVFSILAEINRFKQTNFNV